MPRQQRKPACRCKTRPDEQGSPPSAAVAKLTSRRREETKSPETEASSRDAGRGSPIPKSLNQNHAQATQHHRQRQRRRREELLRDQLAQYLKDQQIEHRAIDTDNENSTLKRFHREAEFINIEKVQEIDLLFASLEPSSLVVVDCRAASTDIFLDYFREVRVFELSGIARRLMTVVSPVNHEADSVEQVKIIADALGGKCRYVMVKNQAHSEQFKIYDKAAREAA